MAVRRSILLTGLLVLLLLIPAVSAAGGHASGGQGAGSPAGESGRGSDNGAGDTDAGTRADTTGGSSSSATRGGVGAGAAPPDTGAIDSAGVASAPKNPEASAVAAHGSTLAGGAPYRAGAEIRGTAVESGTATRQPLPEVSHASGRQYVVQSETVGARAVRASHGGSGTGRGDGSEAPGPRDGGRHGSSAPTNPVPYAAPTRSAHGQDSPDPGKQGAPSGRGRKETSHLPPLVTDDTETPDPVLLLRFLLVLGFRRVRPGNVLEHPLRRALHVAIRADPGLDLAGCAAATGANRETLRYHLALLVCCGKVVEEARSGSVRYFPHDPTMTPVRRALLHALRNESLAPLLSSIRESPGLSRQELADRRGVAGPSVTRQVQRLIEDGLVESERCGRSTCYRLTAACTDAFGETPETARLPLGEEWPQIILRAST